MHCGVHSPGQTIALFSEKLNFFFNSTSVLSLFPFTPSPFSTLHTIESYCKHGKTIAADQ